MGISIVTAAKLLVILLMLSMGLRITHRSLMTLWRRPRLLTGSIVAAFLAVPVFTYLVIQVVPLTFASKAGLWIIAITPGAPMIGTTASRRELSDSQLAASFQFTVAVLVIVLAPVWLIVTSAVSGLDYAVGPAEIAEQVCLIQLIPILVGVVIHHLSPNAAVRIGSAILRFTLPVLVALVIVILVFVGKRLGSSTSGWDLLAAALVVASAIGAGYVAGGSDAGTRITIANANAQRNPGLALAIAASNMPEHRPAIMLVIVLYVLIAAAAGVIHTRLCAARRSGELEC